MTHPVQCRNGEPAVNVKCYNLRPQCERALQETVSPDRWAQWEALPDAVREQWMERGFNQSQRAFWELLDSRVEDIGDANGFTLTVSAEGRSGGWAVLHGMPDPATWVTMPDAEQMFDIDAAFRSATAELLSLVPTDIATWVSQHSPIGPVGKRQPRWVATFEVEFDGPTTEAEALTRMDAEMLEAVSAPNSLSRSFFTLIDRFAVTEAQ